MIIMRRPFVVRGLAGFGILLLVLTVGQGLCLADMKTNSWQGLTFQTPAAFSAPMEIGMGAVSFLYPAKASMAKAQFEITMVTIKKEQQEKMGMDDAGLLNYAKSTYLATAKPAQKYKERKILGRAVKGEVQEKSIPKKSRLESYLITLADGTKVVLAFTIDVKMPKKDAEGISDAVARTLTESK